MRFWPLMPNRAGGDGETDDEAFPSPVSGWLGWIGVPIRTSAILLLVLAVP